MIKLDNIDSQIVLLTKFHFGKELTVLSGKNKRELTWLDGLRAIWADRCGIDIKHVTYPPILWHLIELLAICKGTPESMSISMIEGLIGGSMDLHYGQGYNPESGSLYATFINECLGRLQNLQVYSSEDDTCLVQLEEKDGSFLKWLEPAKHPKAL